jgi:hypothetical protein
MLIAHLSFRDFSHPPAFKYIACLLLINAYCPSFFPSLSSPFSPFFRPFLRHI